ncbi:MAG: hypothetical protein Q9173_004530 [Seirophora scorigena]
MAGSLDAGLTGIENAAENILASLLVMEDRQFTRIHTAVEANVELDVFVSIIRSLAGKGILVDDLVWFAHLVPSVAHVGTELGRTSRVKKLGADGAMIEFEAELVFEVPTCFIVALISAGEKCRGLSNVRWRTGSHGTMQWKRQCVGQGKDGNHQDDQRHDTENEAKIEATRKANWYSERKQSKTFIGGASDLNLLAPLLSSHRRDQNLPLSMGQASWTMIVGYGPGTVFAGQMYVEKLQPRHPTQKYPLIFIPSAGQTSTSTFQSADGRHISKPSKEAPSEAPPSIEQIFTAPEKFPNISSAYAQAPLHTQWPGTGLRGDPNFDQFYATQVPLQLDSNISDRLVKDAMNALIDKVGTCVLIAHSQAGPYGWVAGDSRPELVKGNVAIEPEGPPFAQLPGRPGQARVDGVTRLPLRYDPPVKNISRDLKTVQLSPPRGTEGLYSPCTLQASLARKLVNLSKDPVALVTGEASYHAPYDYCFIEYFKQTGVEAT